MNVNIPHAHPAAGFVYGIYATSRSVLLANVDQKIEDLGIEGQEPELTKL